MKPLIDRVMKKLDIKTDEELIELFKKSPYNVNLAKRQIKRWRETGLRPSTEVVIKLLLDTK